MRSVISNTSCLIALSNIGRLNLLRDVYGHILVTHEVATEFGEPLPEWITIVAVKDSVKHTLPREGITKSNIIALIYCQEST